MNKTRSDDPPDDPDEYCAVCGKFVDDCVCPEFVPYVETGLDPDVPDMQDIVDMEFDAELAADIGGEFDEDDIP